MMDITCVQVTEDRAEATPAEPPTHLGDPEETPWLEWQRQDPDLQQICLWVEVGTLPPDLDKRSLSLQMRQLLREWDRLKMDRGLLMRQIDPGQNSPSTSFVRKGKKGPLALCIGTTSAHAQQECWAARRYKRKAHLGPMWMSRPSSIFPVS
ncbi:unnamed protein product [Gadus morhua 'NCC']